MSSKSAGSSAVTMPASGCLRVRRGFPPVDERRAVAAKASSNVVVKSSADEGPEDASLAEFWGEDAAFPAFEEESRR